MSLNPTASAFFPIPYDPRTGTRMMPPPQPGTSQMVAAQPLQQHQQPTQMYPNAFIPNQPAGVMPTQGAPSPLVNGVNLPLLVTTPTFTPLQAGIAPPTPTLTLTPGGPSSPNIPNLPQNMPHLVLHPVFPTPSPRTGAPTAFGSSPLVTGLSGPGGLVSPLTPNLFSSPAFSTVAIASPLTPTMPAPGRLDQLQLGSAAFAHHSSPRVHQASFTGSVVGSRTAPARHQLMTPPLQINSPKGGAKPVETTGRPRQADLSENEVPRRAKKLSQSQSGNKTNERAPEELPPPMLSADDTNVTRSMQIQPPQQTFLAYPGTPPMTALQAMPIPFGNMMPMPPAQPQILTMAAPYQQLATQPPPTLQSMDTLMQSQPTSTNTVQSMNGSVVGAQSTSSGSASVHHPTMSAVPNGSGLLPQAATDVGARSVGGLVHSTSAPSLAPKQFGAALMRQYSDTDAHRNRFAHQSKLISKVELSMNEEERNIPREVVWLVGPPSSGRSTLARYVCQLRGFTVNGEHATIDMDNVWRIISERNHQDQIQGIQPLEEAQTLLETILKSQSTNGLVIDGYLTKTEHIDYIKEMFDYFRSQRPTVRFAFVLLDCTEDQITNRWRTKHNIPRNIRRSQQKSKELNTWRRHFQDGVEKYNGVRKRLIDEYDINPINADHNLRAVQRDLEGELSRRRHGEMRSESRYDDDRSVGGHTPYGSYSGVHTPHSDGYRSNNHIQHGHGHRRYNRSGGPGGNGGGGNGGGSTPTGSDIFGSNRGFSKSSSNRSSMVSAPSRGDRHGRFKVQRSITHTVMSKITQRVRQRVIEMIYPRVPRHDSMRTSNLFHRLPAKFPVTMSQIRLDQIKRNDYWVSEKTDGVRYLMYIEKQHSQRRSDRRRQARSNGVDDGTVEEFNCYLIDRKFFICRVCGDLYISGQDNDALLDGEFVTIEDEQGQERPIFIVFDAVQVSHLNIAKNAYSVRHKHIRNLVDRIPAHENEQFPLQITYKPLIEASRLQDVMSHIRYDDSRHKYVHDGAAGLVTLNDGLIFMPEHSPYLPSEHDLPVVKWKWKELNTVDLLVKQPFNSGSDSGLSLYCQGDGNNPVVFQKKNLPPEHERVFQMLVERAAAQVSYSKNGRKTRNGSAESPSNGDPPSEFIVECVWDPGCSMWCPKWLRLDKNAPNYIKVAKAINRDLSEFISPETLVRTLSREEVSQAVLNLGLRS